MRGTREVPIWMATAISELGLTKEDFDAFFDAQAVRLCSWEEKHSKSRRVESGSLSWSELYRAFLAAPNCEAFGDDGLMPFCSED